MKFRLSALFLTALLAASLAAPALADMIWYPENSFMAAHTGPRASTTAERAPTGR